MTELLMTWWVWIAIALGLAIVELLAPGFIFVGFALGALVIGLLMLALPGMAAGLGLNAVLAIFAAASLVAWLVLRRVFRSQSSGARIVTHDIND